MIRDRLPLAGLLLIVAVLSLGAGCRAFHAKVERKEPMETEPISPTFDQQDLLSLASLISSDLLAHPFPPADQESPILVDMGIQNRTKLHIDMKSISDTMSVHLLDSQKVRFADASRRDDLLKEQGFQMANCTPETRVQIGKQLGAKYMLTGSLMEIQKDSMRQATLSDKKDVYYQLTVEVTDLETGLIVLRKQRDRLRRASEPLIGW